MAKQTPKPNGHPIKLVRDKTPDIINDTGTPGDLFYREFDGDIEPWLKKKLGEEVTEFLVDGGDDELRDVFDVVVALLELKGYNIHDLPNSDPRGGFALGVMMYGYHKEFDGNA